MDSTEPRDWAEASGSFDALKSRIAGLDLSDANEAQTRYDLINSFVREVLGWEHGQVRVEEHSTGLKTGYIDYVLRVGDATVVIEAKRLGAAFPSPTSKGRLKLSGVILGTGEIASAISQAEEYGVNQGADAVCVTNGRCWVFFSTHDRDDDSYATMLFPFDVAAHGESLFRHLSEPDVRAGSLDKLSNRVIPSENRLIEELRDADARIDRNNIADHIVPALNAALYADALLANPESLERCFVPSEARTKFDATLGVHLGDPKSTLITPAKRVKTGQEHGPLETIVGASVTDHAPPVTLLLGPVGAGKSTYLKHFELVSGRKLLSDMKAHWVYLDFEQMGKAGQPRKFLYEQLRGYLLAEHPSKPTDYGSIVEPAYHDLIAGLARGPLAKVFGDKQEFNRRVTDIIQRDFDLVEPYVDRLFKYLAAQQLCVIVLDNIDLYEDEELETAVFAEGLALSKRLNTHVIVSVRDRTFVRHRNSAAFDAYELRKLWLDPPPLRAVIASRLTYARKILQGHQARIALANGMHLQVPDLGAFFDIVQHSVLQGAAGDYIEAVADLNIRRGLSLINNFLTSGHIQADRALKAYINGDRKYYFPFHEVFKGTALGQWKHYREKRAECLNVFDSRLGAKRLRLVRLAVLEYLAHRARQENTLEVAVADCLEIGAVMGCSAADVLTILDVLQRNGLIRTVTAESIGDTKVIVITRSGVYYLRVLSHTLVYTEQCMHDTAIEDPDVWARLCQLTNQISLSADSVERIRTRRERIGVFLEYLANLENDLLSGVPDSMIRPFIATISESVLRDADRAVGAVERWH